MPPRIDLTGRRFGRLIVTGFAFKKGRHLYWVCKCDCGREKNIGGDSLVAGYTRSCTCLKIELMYKNAHTYAKPKHGGYETRIYSVWEHIKSRCLNVNDDNYSNYGGRGITLCSSWMKFEPFRDWAMQNGYSDDLSIDRIDNNGNYDPSNCRWVTMFQQARNTRRNRWFDFNGRMVIVPDIVRETGIPEGILRYWLKKPGWTVQRALDHLLPRYKYEDKA